jgi:hypothetical protein
VGTFSGTPAAGSSYTIAMTISYTDTTTGFSYQDAGTVTGKVTN